MNTLSYHIGRDRILCDPAELEGVLVAAHSAKPFPRLAETDLDVDAGTDNPYWRIVRLLARDTGPWSDPWKVELFPMADEHAFVGREPLCKTFAWSIPSPADLLWMRDILAGRNVVEIGAGSGYWAWQLQQLGIEVAAIDNKSWKFERQWTDVTTGDASTAADHPDRALLLVWPPHSEAMATGALTAYTGDLVIYAGEGEGGCTGDQGFHDKLAVEWTEIAGAPHHPTFSGIHCRLTAYRRNHAEEATS